MAAPSSPPGCWRCRFPPLAPWWLIVVGTLFAIVVAKHLYGGLGHNIFNPAMVGYAVLIVSFPAQMTQWPAPLELASAHLSWRRARRHLRRRRCPRPRSMPSPWPRRWTPCEPACCSSTLWTRSWPQPIFGHYGGNGFEWLALAYLLGGLLLWQQRIISWHVPLAFLAGIWLTAGFLHFFDAGRFGAPWFHLFTGGAMLGAFFIATDPVSGATTPRGKLIFGLGAGFLTIVIRTWGGYPDGVAFAVLLMNWRAADRPVHPAARIRRGTQKQGAAGMTSPLQAALKNALRTGTILFAFALVGTAMLAFTHSRTEPAITRGQLAEKLRADQPGAACHAVRQRPARPASEACRPTICWAPPNLGDCGWRAAGGELQRRGAGSRRARRLQRQYRLADRRSTRTEP